MIKFICVLYLLILVYGDKNYQLLIHAFLTGEFLFDIDLVNEGTNNSSLNYYGSLENIQNIIENIANLEMITSEVINNSLKDLNYPVIYILDLEYINYINLFPPQTTFIVFNGFTQYFKYENYTIFSINNEQKFLFYQQDLDNKFYYIKIGVKNDYSFNILLHILLVISLITSIIIAFIITKTIKNLIQASTLYIYLLICISSYLLIVSNFINSVFFTFFKNREYCFIIEYTIILIYSFYKSYILTTILLVLLGWGTIFFGWGNTFKKLNRYLFLIDLICSISIPISVYFIKFTSKLNLFYIKNSIEYILLFCINIFSFFKRVIPLEHQMKYEQRIGSNLFNCIAFKYNKLVLINIIMAIYIFFFILTIILDYKYMNFYVNNYNHFFLFQLLFETIFFVFFSIIFFPKSLPEIYFDDVVFKYKSQLFLVAHIYDDKKIYNPSINDDNNDIIDNKYSNKLNISLLTYDILNQTSKKKTAPIIFIKPFACCKNKKIFKEIHLGTIIKK
jgi:hypothetical protein